MGAPAGILLGLLLLGGVGVFLVSRRLGRWLVAGDPLERAHCLFVLGGHTPFRALEAAAIYHQGWAREIWLGRYPQNAEAAALAAIGIETTPEDVINRRVLEHVKVPADAIAVVDGPAVDTLQELRNVHRLLRERHPGGTIILVTSGFHARRVAAIWKSLARGAERAVVRTARDPSFVPDRWFTDKKDIGQVAHEFFGLLNLWTCHPLGRRIGDRAGADRG